MGRHAAHAHRLARVGALGSLPLCPHYTVLALLFSAGNHRAGAPWFIHLQYPWHFCIKSIYSHSLSFVTAAQFGHSVLASNLLSVPIYFVAALVTVTVSYLSDRSKERFVHCAVPGALGCIFFAAMACVIDTDDRNLKFFLLMALVAVCWSLVPPLLSLLMSMLKGPTSSATGSAFCVSFGNLGGFVGPSICGWSKTAANSYGPACVCFSVCLFLFSTGMMALRYRLRNELPSGAGPRFSFDALPVSEEDAEKDATARVEMASALSASPSPSHSHEGPLYEPAPTPTAAAAPSHAPMPPLPRALSADEARDARLRPMRIRSFHELHASMGIAVVAAQVSSQLTPPANGTASSADP